MTLKNTKTILFASLIATMIIPVYAGNTFAQEQRYTDLFPESNSSPEIQKKIMKSLHATPDPQTHIPTGQDALAQKILTLIELRDSTNDPITKELINSIFDNLETDLLDVGLVLNEKYVENPEEWDGKLEEHMYSQSRYTEPTHTTKSTTSVSRHSFTTNTGVITDF